VEHVVLVWLKDPGNKNSRNRVVESTRDLASLLGVIEVRIGTALPSYRPVVDSSYDVAIAYTFVSEAALREYFEHPRHREAIESVLRPLVDRIQVYDFAHE